MSTQPHEHEDPRWDSGAGERITGQPSVWPTTPRQREELRGEALRRAWLDASYRLQPEPPDAPVLADWGHANCAICPAKAAAEPSPGMNIPALLLSVGFGALLWGLIAYVAWLTWQAVA